MAVGIARRFGSAVRGVNGQHSFYTPSCRGLHNGWFGRISVSGLVVTAGSGCLRVVRVWSDRISIFTGPAVRE